MFVVSLRLDFASLVRGASNIAKMKFALTTNVKDLFVESAILRNSNILKQTISANSMKIVILYIG